MANEPQTTGLFRKKLWVKFIYWLASDYIRDADIRGYKRAYAGAALIVDLDCISMNALYADKSKRDCFKDLKEHFERCARNAERGPFDQLQGGKNEQGAG